MTSLVDLGFLLITFFIFTATISQPAVTRLVMPKDGEPTPVAESKTLTLLLDKEKIFLHEGQWEEAVINDRLKESSYDLQQGVGKSIRLKQQSLDKKDDLVVLIKPLPTASYQNVLTALDEMQINAVKKYALLNASSAEVAFIRQR